MTERAWVRKLIAALVVLILWAPAAARAQSDQTVTIGYVDLAGDSRYQPIRASERMILARRERPFAGAEVALDEAKAISRVIHRDFALDRITADRLDELDRAVAAAEQRGIRFFVLDLPAAAVERLATAERGRDVVLFNATAGDDMLRRTLCSPELVHTIPSRAMIEDAIAQYLVFRHWGNVLLLQGPLDDDAMRADAFAHSVAKFGARVVERRGFKPGNDPREREENNVALLTATDRDYDVVFIADSDGDFARFVPYRTTRARPVVGATGLVAAAWDWTWDRYGAPQLSNRFLAAVHRPMTGLDWAAWIAVKMVVQAALRSPGGDFAALKAQLLGDTTYDGVKGLAVSVRPWDHQLRQAILLATPDAVIAAAPLPGFLHAINELDTLGDDRPETPCHLDGG